MPAMDLGDEIPDIQSLTPAELDLVPYEKKYLLCGVDNCCSYSAVRDYGLGNVFYWPRGNKPWMNCRIYFRICAKHWKMYRRFWDNQRREDVAAPKSYECKIPVTKEQLKIIIAEIKQSTNGGK